MVWLLLSVVANTMFVVATVVIVTFPYSLFLRFVTMMCYPRLLLLLLLLLFVLLPFTVPVNLVVAC